MSETQFQLPSVMLDLSQFNSANLSSSDDSNHGNLIMLLKIVIGF